MVLSHKDAQRLVAYSRNPSYLSVSEPTQGAMCNDCNLHCKGYCPMPETSVPYLLLGSQNQNAHVGEDHHSHHLLLHSYGGAFLEKELIDRFQRQAGHTRSQL